MITWMWEFAILYGVRGEIVALVCKVQQLLCRVSSDLMGR